MDESNVIEVNFEGESEPVQVFVDNNKVPQHRECQHVRLALNHATSSVGCKDCGEKLDPMWVLNRIAEKHNTLYWNYSDLYRKAEKASQMNRCKCVHCGNMTPIVKS